MPSSSVTSELTSLLPSLRIPVDSPCNGRLRYPHLGASGSGTGQQDSLSESGLVFLLFMWLTSLGKAPPFYRIEGLINVRSLPLPATSSSQAQRGLILRSGEPNHITDVGKSQLLQLGIKKIFDLRSPKEGSSKLQAEPLTIPGIDIVNIPALPVSQSENMGLTLSNFSKGGDQPFLDNYADILAKGASAFKVIFEFMRDDLPKGNGCLIHCTGELN